MNFDICEDNLKNEKMLRKEELDKKISILQRQIEKLAINVQLEDEWISKCNWIQKGAILKEKCIS